MQKLLPASALALMVIVSLTSSLASPASASPIVTVDSYTVAPGSSVNIAITVTDDGTASQEDIEGMNFVLQIADGNGTAPAITSVNMLMDTIWSANTSPINVSTPDDGLGPQFQVRTLITDNGGEFANANGVVARLVIDTTGAALGDYPLRLTGTIDPGSDCDFIDGAADDVPATFIDGVLHVQNVPEPASIAVLSVSAIGLFSRRRIS